MEDFKGVGMNHGFMGVDGDLVLLCYSCVFHVPHLLFQYVFVVELMGEMSGWDLHAIVILFSL